MAMTPEPLKAGRASNISAVQVSAHVLRETGEVVEAAGVAVELFESENDVELLEQSGASAGLIRILKQAVGNSEGVEVVWKES
jgi:hypothetical protein